MEMTVKILAWRILRRMASFQQVYQPPDSFAKVTSGTDESAIGVYRNREDTWEEAFLVTDKAIHLNAATRIRSCYFSTIERITIPEATPKREVSELLIYLRDGEAWKLPIRGGGERVRDVFEFLRFLANETRSVRASPAALPWKVRNATLSAVEVRMGLNATAVVSVSGRPYLLAGVSHFFDFDGESGRNIRLSSRRAATADRAAIRLAERKAQEDAGVVAVGLPRQSGVPNITFFASEARTGELVDEAFRLAQFSERLLNLYSRPLPPLREEIRALPQLRARFELESDGGDDFPQPAFEKPLRKPEQEK